jgi:hypothetical protein
MRATSAALAALLTAATAAGVTACGGSGGGSDTIDGGSSPTPTAASVSATTPEAAKGAPPRIDPALALPADLKVVFDWSTPAGHTQAAALTDAADFIQAITHAVVKQDRNDVLLRAYAAHDALAYAQNYVQQNVQRGLTLTGTDRYYRPAVKVGTGGETVEITLCNDQGRLFSKETATGKVHTSPPDDASYSVFDIVMARLPTSTELWQANSITVKGKALECEQ